jgi:hypothetical protein
MTLDIRLPIGLLFTVIGALLVAQGLIQGALSGGAAAGLNVDAWWGCVLLVFGAAMLLFAHRHARRPHG